MNKWIKVQDRLPEDLHPVLVSAINKIDKTREIPTLASYCGGWGFERNDIHKNSIVTHWQPLPNNPK